MWRSKKCGREAEGPISFKRTVGRLGQRRNCNKRCPNALNEERVIQRDCEGQATGNKLRGKGLSNKQYMKGVLMRSSNSRYEEDGESTAYPMRQRLRYSSKKKPQGHQRAKVKRSSNDETAKRGIHQRRNKPMNW